MKTGRYSKEEDIFLEENVETMSWAEMAQVLNRTSSSVKARCDKLDLSKDPVYNEAKELNFDLKERPYYSELEGQFSTGELKIFEYHWSRMINQFGGDILPTEEVQIVDIIKLEIMMNRNLAQQRYTIETVDEMKQAMADEREKETPNKNMIMNLERELVATMQGSTALVREYREIQEKKDKSLGLIKATRGDRIKSSAGKVNFVSLIQSIINNPELRKSLGIKMEKRRLAAQKAKETLSNYHTYVDGAVDQPLLTSETVKDDNTKLFLAN